MRYSTQTFWFPRCCQGTELPQGLQGKITPCYDLRILEEYREVLSRPKFSFPADEVNALLDRLLVLGRSVLAEPLDGLFIDESDRKFYEVAKFCGAALITGNARHFPSDPLVVSPSEFLKRLED